MKQTMGALVALSTALVLGVPAPGFAAHAGPGPAAPQVTTWSHGRGRLGAQVSGLTDALRQHFGAPRGVGILVSDVVPGSPADKAGVAVGDVIVEVAGQKIEDALGVSQALSGKKRGEAVPVVVVRDRKAQRLTATLDGDAPEVATSWRIERQGSGDDVPDALAQRMQERLQQLFGDGALGGPPLPLDGEDDDGAPGATPFDRLPRGMARGAFGEAASEAVLARLGAIERRLEALEKAAADGKR